MAAMVTADGWLKNLRVFLTGHTGFKGSWLSLLLRQAGAEVFGYALPPLAGGIYDRADVSSHVAESTYADIGDVQSLSAALQRSRADVVLHLAAQPLVRQSYADPVGTYAVNVMGVVHILEAVRRQASVRVVLIVSSDKCYDNKEWTWAYRENEPMGGHDPYSSSKGCAELVTSAYRRSYFSNGSLTRVASARAGNVIGGGDWAADRLVPDVIRSLLAGCTTDIRNPQAIRPWQHVLEPLAGYLRLTEALLSADGERFAEGWNFGPSASAERTVEDVVSGVCRRWGKADNWRKELGDRLHEANFLKLDSSRANRLLGWTPLWSFDEALDRTVDWYRADAAGQNMADKTLQQIRSYAAETGA